VHVGVDGPPHALNHLHQAAAAAAAETADGTTGSSLDSY
jgi:hypothetical protein